MGTKTKQNQTAKADLTEQQQALGIDNPAETAVEEPEITPQVQHKPPEREEIGSGRIPYADRNKLTAMNRDPNFKYRIVNSDDSRYAGRIADLQKRGYTVCNDDEVLGDEHGTEANQIGSVVGKPVGHGVRGVLMKIPIEFYVEDKAAKQAEVDLTEEGMVDEELRTGDDIYGEGLKIEDAKGTRLEVRRR